ncbi:TadE family type IV pilus minor pilin [Pseudonocardia alni]|uniref:TadE family type IV pilus minor pilin n=1 Tax=Pseudonocardia alni subsp. carboxydivorans TaxID=415010 RepID=A0ABU9AES5_PSEA5
MRCPRRSDPHRTGRGGHRTVGRGAAVVATNGLASSAADDDGAVTVEAALALGTLVAVTAAAVGAVAAVAAGVRCTDAARELARQAARGDTERGRAVAAQLAPAGAEPELRLDGDLVVVTVRVRPVGLLPVTISGTASAAVEPGVATGAARSAAQAARPGVTAGSAPPGGAS